MDRPLPETWRNLNSTKRDILVLLAIDAPRSGADLNRQLGVSEAHSPVTYNALVALREDGLVTAETYPDKAKKGNKLTASGRELVRECIVKTARLVETADVMADA